MKEEGTHFEGDIFVPFFVGVHIACNYSVIISLCNLRNIGLDKVIIIIRGNKSKSNYIEQII
jgi:hypothetical protein